MAISDEELYSRAKELSKDFDDSFLDLGKALSQLKKQSRDMFRKLYQSTNLGRRKAYYLVEVYEAFRGIPVSRAKLKEVGWSKLQLIGKHVTKDNAQELLDLAKEMSLKQLDGYLRGEKLDDNARCVLMYLSPKQYEVLEEVLLAHGGTKSGRGIVDKEDALITALKKLTKGKSSPLMK